MYKKKRKKENETLRVSSLSLVLSLTHILPFSRYLSLLHLAMAHSNKRDSHPKCAISQRDAPLSEYDTNSRDLFISPFPFSSSPATSPLPPPLSSCFCFSQRISTFSPSPSRMTFFLSVPFASLSFPVRVTLLVEAIYYFKRHCFLQHRSITLKKERSSSNFLVFLFSLSFRFTQ